MRTKTDLAVSLVKRMCPVCGKLEDSEIIMNTLLVKQKADKVRELHGKVIGYMDTACSECLGKFKEVGVEGIYIIGFDPNKSVEEKGDFFLTGDVAGMSMEWLDRFADDVGASKELVTSAKKRKYLFMPCDFVRSVIKAHNSQNEV